MSQKSNSSSSNIMGFLIILFTVISTLFLTVKYQDNIDDFLTAVSEKYIDENSSETDGTQAQPYQEVLTIEPSAAPSIKKEVKNPLGDIGKEIDYNAIPSPPPIIRNENYNPVEMSSFSLSYPSSSGLVGKTGLLPGTQIAVLQEMTDDGVKFSSCTVGFSLPGKGAFPWAITAGHCGNVGDKVYNIILTPDGNIADMKFLGTVRYASIFNSDENTSDWGAIRLNPKAQIPPVNQDIPLFINTKNIHEGDELCKYGSRTKRSCGPKVDSNVLVKSNMDTRFDTQTVVGYADKAKLCALPGDSGGPVFDKDGIVGIISSTSIGVNSNFDDDTLRCDTEDEAFSYYIPVESILQQIKTAVPDIDI